jgi:hypothetical protein
MQHPHLTPCAAICATLLLAASTLLTGCSNNLVATPAGNAVSVTGNWQFASAAPAAAKLPAISGELTGTSAAITGILHADSTSACVAPSTAIDVTGSTNATGVTTLTSSDFPSGTLTITGTVAADGKSLTNATYNVTGVSCAFAAPAVITADDYSPITGNYTGTFKDTDGDGLTVNATLSQSPSSDPNGNFTLSGTGTFPSNPCFNSPVTVSNTQVTGGSFTLTYADPTTQNSVTATGTFSTDGTTLTVTNWTLTGSCGPDTGTGTLTRQ